MSTKLTFRTHAVSEKFNPNARYSGQLEGVKTLGTEITVKEAIEKNFIANQKPDLVANTVTGVLKSMIAGVQADGNARAIDGVISFTPYMTGGFAGKKSSFDPAKNAIVVRARLMKELKIDNGVFSLTNATDGVVVKLTGICSTSENDGFVKFGEDLILTGEHLKGAAVSFVYGELKGEVDAKLVTDNMVQCAWPAAIAEKIDEDEKLVITVKTRGGDNEGEIQEVSCEALVTGECLKPRIVSMIGEVSGKDGVSKGWEDPMTISLANCTTEGAKVRRVLYDGDIVDADTGWDMGGCTLEILSPTEMTFTCDENRTREPFNNWMTKFRPVTEVKLADGTIISYPMSFEED